MNTLNQTLEHHFGSNYSEHDLRWGTINRFGTKRYLSYHKKRGWEVKDLNFLQNIIRYIFYRDIYRSTHLNHVIIHLNEDKSLSCDRKKQLIASFNAI